MSTWVLFSIRAVMYSGLSVKWLAYYRCCLKFTWLLLLELLKWYCLTYELSCPPMSSGLSVKWLTTDAGACITCLLLLTTHNHLWYLLGGGDISSSRVLFLTEVCVYTVWGYQNLSMKIYANTWNNRVNHTCATWTKMRFVDKMGYLKPGFKWLDHILIRMTSGFVLCQN